MPKYMLSYRMANDYTPGGEGTMEAWVGFFENLGGAVVERGNPIFEATALGNCGANTHLGGWSIITADDLESATALAKGTPALGEGGGVEVGEISEIM
jgi:hypothetical protein